MPRTWQLDWCRDRVEMRRRAALSVAGAMEKALLPRRRKVVHEEASVVSLNAQSAKGLRRASSPASRRLRHRQKRWQRRVVAHLIRSHVARQIRSGRRGLLPSRAVLSRCEDLAGGLPFLWVALRGMRIMPILGDRPRLVLCVFNYYDACRGGFLCSNLPWKTAGVVV